MRKTLRPLVLLLLCVCIFCGCAGPSSGPDKQDEPGEVRVKVQNLGGTPLSGVIVSVYLDSTLSELLHGGLTDQNGVFSFSGPLPEGAVAILSKLPVGYEAEERYTLSGSDTTISLGAGTMTEADMESVRYVLGDAVLDFSVTMSDGEAYTLSGLLSDRKAVVLNFWFMGCGPCRSEFPHLQQAYEEYGEDIAVLALDPVDSSDPEIEAFRQENGYTFPMGKCDIRWIDMMQADAFPLTVVIDRYGNISLMHLGAIPDTQVFKALFAHYCADDYQQGFYNSIDQVPGVG